MGDRDRLLASQVHPRVSPEVEADYRRKERALEDAARRDADAKRAIEELDRLRSSPVAIAVRRGTW